MKKLEKELSEMTSFTKPELQTHHRNRVLAFQSAFTRMVESEVIYFDAFYVLFDFIENAIDMLSIFIFIQNTKSWVLLSHTPHCIFSYTFSSLELLLSILLMSILKKKYPPK